MSWLIGIVFLAGVALLGLMAIQMSNQSDDQMDEFQRDEGRWMKFDGYAPVAIAAVFFIWWFVDWVL